ncbi:MAG: aminoglycoside phosphotransferase family protein [Lachnospiraceae bacterium]|nr:aminoglycoside phosphotransferase family protein [Lachnospiraceae bacterium]
MKKELVESILDKWEIDHPIMKDMYKKDSEEIERIICRISTDNQDFIIKGIPNKEESIIQSNVQAHLFLGNEHSMAPKLFPTKEGTYYIQEQGYYFYLMEYIDGRSMEENVLDEYKIGQLAHKLHSLKGYGILSPFTQSKKEYYDWFSERDFKKEFDEILDSLPDFSLLSQCFVHTDIGPHNTMVRQNGEVVFIDLDDSGLGSRYLDLGWPFIMQFVDFNHETEEMNYRFDLAQSLLEGYYGDETISREEYDLIFQGAIQMHISYMQTYGLYAVDSLWKILLFGIDQKEILWERMKNSKGNFRL